MRIMICGSMAFASRINVVKQDLKALAHQVLVAKDIDQMIQHPEQANDLDADLIHCIENRILEDAFNKVDESDAILILNYFKNGIEGYIGTSVLMEMAVAYHLRKKIFLLNPLPDYNKHRWAHEAAIMQPIIIGSDLSLLEKS